MSYQALARTWRPRHFSEVTGQDHAVRALTRALDQDRVHHAFLFTGTRGVGKTTIARLLAKALNCEKGVSSKPCGECERCRSIEEGRFVDLIEVDAASRTRVDDTREILDNVQYAPTSGSYKVYLIDEVHMLSTHSFNALLKTLEEPPAHVKFLLATTDPHKLPATILSRCLQFNLRAIDTREIASNLKMILESEAIKYDERGLLALARVASGSMRDGLSLLDQAIAFGEGMVTGDSVREMLGMLEDRYLDEILEALVEEDAEALVKLTKLMEEQCIDYVTALDELLLMLQDIALYHVSVQAVEAKEADIERIKILAAGISVENAQLFYQIGLHGKRDLSLAPNASSGFEMTLLRMMAFQPDNSNASKKKISNLDVLESHHLDPISEKKEDALKREVASRPIFNNSADLSSSDVWADLVERSSLEGIPRELAMNMAPIKYNETMLTVTIDGALDELFNKERKLIIEKAIYQAIGKNIRVDVISKSVDLPPEIETPLINQKRHSETAKSEAFDDLMKDSVVKDVIERFDAKLDKESIKLSKKRCK